MHHKPALRSGLTEKSATHFWYLPVFRVAPVRATAGHVPHSKLLPPCFLESLLVQSLPSGRGHQSFHPNTTHKTDPYPSGEAKPSGQKSREASRSAAAASESSTAEPRGLEAGRATGKCEQPSSEFLLNGLTLALPSVQSCWDQRRKRQSVCESACVFVRVSEKGFSGSSYKALPGLGN